MNRKNGLADTVGHYLRWNKVHISSGFWAEWQKVFLQETLPIELAQLERTGRLDSVKGTWKEGQPNKPHFFWDSDIAKWIEAVAYSLAICPNRALEARVDGIIEDIEGMQQPDGYFNTYYTLVEPGKRFTYLKRMHELYCLGHMIEAAVAYWEVTGKSKLLDVVCRYVDLVDRLFGQEEGKIRGYDGHEEIELALMKLYAVTGNSRHLALARFFVNERGKQPHFYELECASRGECVEQRKYRDDMQGMYAYYQAHKPAREQDRAVGHAVRATYFYCAVQDVAEVDGDAALQVASDAIFSNIVEKQMYITGGIGPNPVGERFTFEYDLPNEMSYNETCASIGLFLFAARKLKQRVLGLYGDVMERCLFNNIIGGVSLTGNTFYYANPLTVVPEAYENICDPRPQVTVLRQEWFDVACCPPNLARLVMSLGGYLYLLRGDTVYVNLYMANKTVFSIEGTEVQFEQRTGYPWEGEVELEIAPAEAVEFALALRLPAWSAKRYELTENGKPLAHEARDGFLIVRRTWSTKAVLRLTLDMRPRLTQAHPRVAADTGRVALERGPLVYCFEERDNGKCLNDLSLIPGTLTELPYDQQLLGGIVPLRGVAVRRDQRLWNTPQLYQEWNGETEEVEVQAVPFYARFNRGAGEMIVWIQCQEK